MTATTQETGWRSFMAEPASYAEGSRLAACFGASVTPALGAQLLESHRVRDQISRLLMSRYELGDVATDELTAEDRGIALLSADELLDLVMLAGAIYWSSALAGVVMAKDVQALHDALGAALCAEAIRHRDRGAPSLVLTPFDTLAARISEDGWRCLAAWCDAMPNGVGKRVRLKLPASVALDTSATSPFTERGPDIVRRAANANEAVNG